METSTHFIGITGSLRKGSFNTFFAAQINATIA